MKGHISYDSIYMKGPENRESRDRKISSCLGLEVGTKLGMIGNGYGFLFRMVQMNLTVVMVHNSVNILKVIKLHTLNE